MSNICTWPLTNISEQRRLERAFSNRNIDFSSPAFHDSANFIAEEQRNARFLEAYARYVEVRTYSVTELEDARQKISIVTEAIRNAVATDGRHGLCVHASGVIGRMLDQLGVWNYVAKSTLTVNFPSVVTKEPLYFWAIDSGKFYAPHAIVVAPPFGIIDVTVKHQPYSDTRMAEALPDMVQEDKFSLASWSSEDIANNEIRALVAASKMKFHSFLEHEYPSMLEVIKHIPPREVKLRGIKLKYVIVAIGGLVEPLFEIHKNISFSNRTPQQIFTEEVLPRIHNS